MSQLNGNAIESDQQKKPPNRHYIPKWLLEKFRQPYLWELDIFSAEAEKRKPRKAGSAADLWPQDIEDQLTVHDTNAAEIYRYKIKRKHRIVLNGAERREFALWLAHFYVRVPNVMKDVERHLEKEKTRPIDMVRERRADVLKRYRDLNPQLYDEAVKEVGQEDTEEFLLADMAERISRAAWPGWQEIHHHYMRNNSADKFAKRLCEYDWVWMYSRHEFVIGDNPLVRWHEKTKSFNAGINRSGVRITIPLGVHLCLSLEQRHRSHNGNLMLCNHEETRLLNVRQRFAAIKFVYGNSPEALDFVSRPVTR